MRASDKKRVIALAVPDQESNIINKQQEYEETQELLDFFKGRSII